jgi:hypothetical protein
LVAVLIGTQLLAIGFVAEMIAALVSRDRDEFSIAQYASPREDAAPRATPVRASQTRENDAR